MTEGNESGSNSTVDNASNHITGQIVNGQLFGPFSDPLQWLAYKTTTSVCSNNSNNSLSNDLFANVNISRHSGEQNMEIIMKDSQFYFKAMYDIENNNNNNNNEMPKLYAWFNKELNDKLPAPCSSTINGSKRYYCALCNEVFMYPNLVVIHLLFNCLKNNQISSVNQSINDSSQVNTLLNPTTPVVSHSKSSSSSTLSSSTLSSSTLSSSSTREITVVKAKQPVTKKRGFDIASLVNEEKDDESYTSNSNKHARNEVEREMREIREIKVGEDVCNISSRNFSAFHRPKSPMSQSTQSTQSTEGIVTSLAQSHSAFKKVDQKSNHLSSPYDFSALYHRVAASALMPQTSPQSALMPPTYTTQTTLPTGAGLATSLSGSKSLVSNSLLPYLPPSLAALTFAPSSNWCAKCNATFRMTSDLVYHMRSHHKNSSAVDPLKKKREEKLRCTICQETFRERHHLTRHMTSHQ